ncbi:MAG TPA: FAD-binding oxidoreductase [Candidatus Angelobacter sp.]
MLYEYCVIGNGLIGAATALELARKSKAVCVLGAAYGQQDRYYSSHEDDSRIARFWHNDPYWEDLARCNAPMLEALAGAARLPVFKRTPVFYSYPAGAAPAGARLRISTHGPHATHFQYEDMWGGIIDPKAYIAALNQQARKHNATVVQCIVQETRWKDGKAVIGTTAGEIHSKRIVDARGMHFDGEAAGLETTVVGKILLYVELAAQRPVPPYCFVDSSCRSDQFEDVYGIACYKASGDRLVSKFGFSEREPVRLRSAEEIAAWFQSGYRCYPYLSQAKELLKNFCGDKAAQVHAKPCAFVTTSDRRPIISLDEHLCTITGCNGMAAKCCQALAQKVVGMWNA